MGSRLLLELLILLSPFAIFGLYRIAVAEAAAEGQKPWPVQRLFIIGFVLAIIAWFALMLLEERRISDDLCPGQSIFVNGELVEGEPVPCERDVKSIGVPASEDPGARQSEAENEDEGVEELPGGGDE